MTTPIAERVAGQAARAASTISSHVDCGRRCSA